MRLYRCRHLSIALGFKEASIYLVWHVGQHNGLDGGVGLQGRHKRVVGGFLLISGGPTVVGIDANMGTVYCGQVVINGNHFDNNQPSMVNVVNAMRCSFCVSTRTASMPK